MSEEQYKDRFFDENCYLNVVDDVYSTKEEYTTTQSAAEILKEKALDSNNGYKVVLHAVNEVKFGYYDVNAQNFVFSDGINNINKKYMIQLRVFNKKEEILIKKFEDRYRVRIIKDDVDENTENAKQVPFVDDASTLFGKNTQSKNMAEGFVQLIERGRKIAMTIPSYDKADYYAMVTRSYIVYDEKTGQAGYGYYRYLDISPEVK